MTYPFVVETGTGLLNSTSYTSTEYADNYFAIFGEQDWPVTPDINTDPTGYATVIAAKQLSLNRATRSVELMFGQRYKSLPYSPLQSLLWPRVAFSINRRISYITFTIPTLLQDAVCEVALLDQNGGNIFPDSSYAGGVRSETVRLGELSTNRSYLQNPTRELLEGFYKIELLLAPLLTEEDEESGVPSFLAL